MDRMIYLSMAGAKATSQRQELLANNLANASTTGFRAELQAFRAVPVRGDGASTRVYSPETTIGYDASNGPLPPTRRPPLSAPPGGPMPRGRRTTDSTGSAPVLEGRPSHAAC